MTQMKTLSTPLSQRLEFNEIWMRHTRSVLAFFIAVESQTGSFLKLAGHFNISLEA